MIGCSSSSKVAEIQGQYDYDKRTKTYNIKHRYKGDIKPYNFLADLHESCYKFYDEHLRWPKHKEELIKFMRKSKLSTKNISQLKRLSFDKYIDQLHLKFEAQKPKYGILRLPKPRHY
jgi:hypothetical protein